MSLSDKNIYFDKNYHFELIGATAKKIIVFSIKKTSHHSIKTPQKQNSFETFLLVKPHPENLPQKNIVFGREKIKFDNNERSTSQQLFLKSQTFYCTFLRHVDLLYCRKLAETLQILNIKTDIPIQNQWLMLYEVQGYKPSVFDLVKFELKSPIYGGRVLIINYFNQNNTRRVGTISNMFRLGSRNVYFVNDTLQADQVNDMSFILSQDNNQIYGLTYTIKEEVICIPLNIILFQKNCQTIIESSLYEKLQKTCYISCLGSYCTGILVETNKIITARHLLPKNRQKLGIQVSVKKFPFKEHDVGVITKIGLGNLDIMEIEIVNKEVDIKIKNNQKVRHKQFVKQYLTGNLIEGEQNLIQNEDLRLKLNFQKNAQKNQTIPVQEKYLLGDHITALGFGRFSYNINVFQKFELTLPTVAIGVISKIIEINKLNLFLKTDAKLYSGFSGCGIWKQNMIAMAVFILKNQTTNSHHNRHNFSYTTQFIQQLRNSNQTQLAITFNDQIQKFDRIQTRYTLDLLKMPHPKL